MMWWYVDDCVIVWYFEFDDTDYEPPNNERNGPPLDLQHYAAQTAARTAALLEASQNAAEEEETGSGKGHISLYIRSLCVWRLSMCTQFKCHVWQVNFIYIEI